MSVNARVYSVRRNPPGIAISIETANGVKEYLIDEQSAALLLSVEGYLKPFHSSNQFGTESADALKPRA